MAKRRAITCLSKEYNSKFKLLQLQNQDLSKFRYLKVYPDILWIDSLADMPLNYDGLIAVPITILDYEDKYYEIIGETGKMEINTEPEIIDEWYYSNGELSDGTYGYSHIIIRLVSIFPFLTTKWVDATEEDWKKAEQGKYVVVDR